MPSPIRQRYLIGFAAAALILVGVGVGVIAAARQSSSDNARVSQTYDVITGLEGLRAEMFDTIATQRNYLLTGEPSYRGRYIAGRPEIKQELALLATQLQKNRAQHQRITRLETLMLQRLDIADESLALFETRGLAAAQTHVRRHNSLGLTDRIRSLVLEMEREQRALLTEHSAASSRSDILLLVLGALGIPLSLAILSWVYVLLSREVRDRQLAVRSAGEANMRLADTVHDLERMGGELRELSHYGSLLQTCHNMPEALEVTRRTISRLLPDAGGTLYLLRESQDQAEAETTWGTHVAPSGTMLQPNDCWALRQSHRHVVSDLSKGLTCNHIQLPAHVEGDRQTGCSACLPLNAQGVTLGMLYLSGPAQALRPNIDTAAAVAEQLSLALANLRLRETLRHQSIRDPLTGLYNRRYLEESLVREIARCERRNLPLAVLMMDLDHFKSLNDRSGHDGGDAVLAAFGRLLQANCREEDIPCRYGGEEFTLILPEIDMATAQRRAEDIRVAVENLSVRHRHQDITGLSVSIGLAMYPAHAGAPGLLKQLADEALYRAKHEGRNQVSTAGSL